MNLILTSQFLCDCSRLKRTSLAAPRRRVCLPRLYVRCSTSGRMIDTANKHQPGGDIGIIVGKKSHRESRRKHDAINLPKNLIDSDTEDCTGECSSEEENEFTQDKNGQNLSMNELDCKFGNMALEVKKKAKEEVLRLLVTVTKKYEDSPAHHESKERDLKARSPYRNRALKHKQNPFDKHDLTVSTPHGTGGRVFVQNLTPCGEVPEPVANIPRDKVLLDAIQDKAFLEHFNELSKDEQEQVFLTFMEQDKHIHNTHNRSISSTYKQSITSPDAYSQSTISPYTQHVMSPEMSPSTNLDMYDSSYETGSPCSTIMTSPGSPHTRFSPPRNSVSSESDQELDLAVESRSIVSTSNILIIPSSPAISNCTSLYTVNSQSKGQIIVKPEPIVRPLGKVVPIATTSASQRLYELSKSTSFCVKHFTIQLVRVVMTTKAEKASDRINDFCKSLLSIMKTKLTNKAHEGDIWQLAIYAHIQFLMAPDRFLEYRPALVTKDERGHSLIHVAAMEHHDKPIIARYIAESMAQVGFSRPLQQLDEKGNTILHLVAEQGDSHIHVLNELVMATGADNRPLLSVQVDNKSGQSPLHLAVMSSKSHVTTVLLLLRMGARPLEQDKFEMTAVHYHVKLLSSRTIIVREEIELLKKMLKAPISLTKENIITLDRLRSDPTISSELSSVIAEEINPYSVKDFKPRKNEKR